MKDTTAATSVGCPVRKSEIFKNCRSVTSFNLAGTISQHTFFKLNPGPWILSSSLAPRAGCECVVLKAGMKDELMFVSMTPGAYALTVMLCSRSSTAVIVCLWPVERAQYGAYQLSGSGT